MKLSTVLRHKNYVSIKLHKMSTNHFKCKASINGIKGIFIVDTGASNTCVDIASANKFKLNTKESKTKAAGAGAINIETKTAHENKLHLQKWHLNSTTIVLIDLSHVNTALTQHNETEVDGIIGADVLEKGEAIIDYKKQRLYLKKLLFSF